MKLRYWFVYRKMKERASTILKSLLSEPPSGSEIPIREAAEVVRGQSYTEILRSDGRRVLNVTD